VLYAVYVKREGQEPFTIAGVNRREVAQMLRELGGEPGIITVRVLGLPDNLDVTRKFERTGTLPTKPRRAMGA
jgi:hypothetical protein